MDPRLRELLNNYETLRNELAEASLKPGILRSNTESHLTLLTELEGAIELANRRKQSALISFSVGDIAEAELISAREHLANVLMQKVECQELIEASGIAARRTHEVIQKLSERQVDARAAAWNLIASELKGSIGGDVIRNVHAVYASISLAGGLGTTYEGFLIELFPPPAPNQAQRLRDELAKDYGFIK